MFEFVQSAHAYSCPSHWAAGIGIAPPANGADANAELVPERAARRDPATPSFNWVAAEGAACLRKPDLTEDGRCSVHDFPIGWNIRPPPFRAVLFLSRAGLSLASAPDPYFAFTPASLPSPSIAFADPMLRIFPLCA